jgi:hypothetical protein
VSLVETCKTKHIRLDLDFEEVVVLAADTIKPVTEDVLKMHNIPVHKSVDLIQSTKLANGVADYGDGEDKGVVEATTATTTTTTTTSKPEKKSKKRAKDETKEEEAKVAPVAAEPEVKDKKAKKEKRLRSEK